MANDFKKIKLIHGSLFSGIGAFELGAEHNGIETLWNCEIQEYNRQVLKKNFPLTKQYEDITKLLAPEYVDIVSGGFPCQDITTLNTKSIGINGKRSGLWSEMWRICRHIRPKYIIIENSSALTFRGFERVLCDLSEGGYNAEWKCFRANEFGLPHRRERLFAIAYPDCQSEFPEGMGNIFANVQEYKAEKIGSEFWDELSLDTKEMVFTSKPNASARSGFVAEPLLRRDDDGISERLHALGNAIAVPICDYLFFCILKREEKKLFKKDYEAQS